MQDLVTFFLGLVVLYLSFIAFGTLYPAIIGFLLVLIAYIFGEKFILGKPPILWIFLTAFLTIRWIMITGTELFYSKEPDVEIGTMVKYYVIGTIVFLIWWIIREKILSKWKRK